MFIAQPLGFIESSYATHVCKLKKAIYGLKKTLRAWHHKLKKFLIASRFTNSHADASLFICQHETYTIYLLIYVDHLILASNDDGVLSQFITVLSHRFSLKDLGPLSFFLDVEVISHKTGLFLSQK